MFLLKCSSLVFFVIGLLIYGEAAEKAQIDVLINSLERIINFFDYDYKNLIADGLFGVVIVEGQLNVILQQISIQNELYNSVINLKSKCFDLINKIKPKLKLTNNEDYDNIVQNILQPKLWEVNNSFVNNSLENLNWNDVPSTDAQKNDDMNINVSNFCISEILTSISNSCLQSLKCKKVMEDFTSSTDYFLTHKVLYWQLAKSLNCKLNNIQYNYIFMKLCSRILQEFKTIEATPRKHLQFQDLYMEQMMLCGLQGYTEFLTAKSLDNLLKWLLHHGSYSCYSSNTHLTNGRWRSKRSTKQMKLGCDSHKTGVGIAAISLNLRYYLSFK